MKHYVLGFVFNYERDTILLVKKKRPKFMEGRWNGIGGKLKADETPAEAMRRESNEEIGTTYNWRHRITFNCPGGTVFVFAGDCPYTKIQFSQLEDEHKRRFMIETLPTLAMANLRWLIPLCLSSVHGPIMLQQNTMEIE